MLIFGVAFGFALLLIFYGTRPSHIDSLTIQGSKKSIDLISWNMAAINNNPFEYWITYDEDPSYERLMKDISTFIDNPDVRDVEVNKVFTDAMALSLFRKLSEYRVVGINETVNLWNKDFRNRKIISEFIKDGLIGKKRLASMPDRITNTINTADGTSVYRPTVINCYASTVTSLQDWFDKWMQFMFSDSINLGKSDTSAGTRVISMLQLILHAKYPAVSEEEERISIPLQTLNLAIFDAILVHMMNSLSSTWQKLRGDICKSLNLHKNDRSIEILKESYSEQGIYFLQEVSFSFMKVAKAELDTYNLYSPSKTDGDRDQNSVILLKKYQYKDVVEVTDEVLAQFPPNTKVPIAEGDLLCLFATDIVDETKYLLCSFHGDTNGLATVPVVEAVHKFATSKGRDAKLLFGMDANTYENPEDDQQGVTDFAKKYTALQLSSCYGDHPDPKRYTTFAARTHLQPQLNKAVAYNEKDIKGDKNPKDFVLFFRSDFEVASAERDNTGVREFKENMVIPTLRFPSDHAITFSTLYENKD